MTTEMPPMIGDVMRDLHFSQPAQLAGDIAKTG
jgi:hypothetical protein